MAYNPAKSKVELPCSGKGCNLTTYSLDRFDGLKPKCYGCYAGPWERPANYTETRIEACANFANEKRIVAKKSAFYDQDRETIRRDVMEWDAVRRSLGYDPSTPKEKQGMKSRMKLLGLHFKKFCPTKGSAHLS